MSAIFLTLCERDAPGWLQRLLDEPPNGWRKTSLTLGGDLFVPEAQRPSWRSWNAQSLLVGEAYGSLFNLIMTELWLEAWAKRLGR